MSRFDLRFFRRHPVRWLRYWWLHVLVAVALWAIAIVWTAEVFEPARAAPAWPVALGGLSGLVLASALAPFARRLQAFVGGSMITFGLVRAAVHVELLIFSDAAPVPLLANLALLWGLFAILGVVWPTWTAASGDAATVEAGRDDRGADVV